MSAEPRIVETASEFVRKNLLGIAATLALVVVAGGVVWTMNCPCEGTPGFVLLGDTHEEPVADWSFANDVSLCAIQIGIWMRPHSVNVNCMATPEGESLHQLLGRRPEVLVSTGGTGPLGTPPARRRRLPRRPQPRDGPGHARPRLGGTDPEAAEAGSAGSAARGRRRTASARHPAAGPLVDVPRHVALVVPEVSGMLRCQGDRPAGAGPHVAPSGWWCLRFWPASRVVRKANGWIPPPLPRPYSCEAPPGHPCGHPRRGPGAGHPGDRARDHAGGDHAGRLHLGLGAVHPGFRPARARQPVDRAAQQAPGRDRAPAAAEAQGVEFWLYRGRRGDF